MKEVNRFLAIVIIFLLSGSLFAQGHDNMFPALKIMPRYHEVFVGDTVQFQAIYMESGMDQTDTTAAWTVVPDSVATIDSTGIFAANAVGEVTVYALLDTLLDSLVVEIEEGDHDGPWDHDRQFFVTPRDTLLQIGGSVQYTAWYRDTSGALIDTTADWGLDGMPIGSVNDDGLLTTTAQGFGLIRATLDSFSASAFVMVNDTSQDTTGMNSITITRENRHGDTITTRTLTEGGIWMIGGLPHPMNVLNGGAVYFPPGSLTEDVRIHTSLPGYANMGTDTVMFHHGVVNGVDFQVFVDDSLREPYYFDTPVIVALPFKRGLLRNLGIDPASLALYFASTTENDSVVFDSTGIGYTTVDSALNRIFSSVAHFSSLALTERDQSTTENAPDHSAVPEGYTLEQNFPNPFNPQTTITYTVPEAGHVQLSVYNALGQRVATLVSESVQSGTYQIQWSGMNDHGQQVSTGVYFYRLESKDFTQMRKMIFMK